VLGLALADVGQPGAQLLETGEELAGQRVEHLPVQALVELEDLGQLELVRVAGEQEALGVATGLT